MFDTAHLDWLGDLTVAAALPIGQWALALGLLLAGLLVYYGVRERYQIVWLGDGSSFCLAGAPCGLRRWAAACRQTWL